MGHVVDESVRVEVFVASTRFDVDDGGAVRGWVGFEDPIG